MTAPPLLNVRRMHVDFGGPTIVEDVSFRVGRGEIIGLVGESGSGKSVASLALMGLLPRANVLGQAFMTLRDGRGVDLIGGKAAHRRGMLGRELSMIFQDPLSSLDPIMTIGRQIGEVLAVHRGLRGAAARARAIGLLDEVGIADPEGCLDLIPQHLSGGMRQRVLIAMAIAGEPELLLADEPTTALDVTVQAQVLSLLRALRDRTGMAMVFITHNLAVASTIADRVIVLYAGQVVEDAPAETFFRAPLMPYSRSLLAAAPKLGDVLEAGRRLPVLPGQVPPPGSRGPGCHFAARCAEVQPERCLTATPALLPVPDAGAGPHLVRCVRREARAA